jgi:hypothetical protein
MVLVVQGFCPVLWRLLVLPLCVLTVIRAPACRGLPCKLDLVLEPAVAHLEHAFPLAPLL